MEQPKELDLHNDDYIEHSIDSLSFQELGNAIHFFAKRSGQRTNREKRLKDLYDARNYLRIMNAKLTELENLSKD